MPVNLRIMRDPRDEQRESARLRRQEIVAWFSLGWVLGSVVVALLQGCQ